MKEISNIDLYTDLHSSASAIKNLWWHLTEASCIMMEVCWRKAHMQEVQTCVWHTINMHSINQSHGHVRSTAGLHQAERILRFWNIVYTVRVFWSQVAQCWSMRKVQLHEICTSVFMVVLCNCPWTGFYWTSLTRASTTVPEYSSCPGNVLLHAQAECFPAGSC